FLSGYMVDALGGKRVLLGGLMGCIVSTVMFPMKVDVVWFAGWRGVEQLASSLGWGAVVKIVRKWYTPSTSSQAIATASLAESLGDAVVRTLLGASLLLNFTWQHMFYISALMGAVFFIPTCFAPAAPAEKGLEMPREQNEQEEERSVFAGQEDGVTVRESFTSYLSTLLTEQLSLHPGTSAMASALFPLVGAVSSLLGGYTLDRIRPHRRGVVPVAMLACLTCSLVLLSRALPESKDDITPSQITFAFCALALTSFFLYAPKIIIDGAFVMDIAGRADKVGSVTAAVTGVGYL
ncbi:hypothetical protein HK104_007831, partial [Borealophlyctis nickersoniae]